ncbi:SDR family NAD(P)-dependent oxidoreductase [Paralimibaculum aggregatum]|uniref:SDR family NAD(P)-dependent oxidoreductase n=1 Tax=Paralimibaculum aggregatum TaxID=3036245 RepID=A0ABQ6LL45_9RHOB|nr:SDR family oxidoreductase [Limibaculum sp. NKW23]GMG81126.1 SDR family NAD(P)-dependent oxidoreductase [Limibaculum sp. NKW23]
MAAEPRPLREQGVAIFGGSSGIGLAAARAFVAEGARVALIARNPERGAAAAASLGPAAHFVAADCAVPAEVARAVAGAHAALGRIDTALVSTGTTHLPELLFRQSLEDVAETLRLDLAPALLAARGVLEPMMADGGGTILMVASDAGKLATPGESVIGAGMAAIIQFARTLALEAKRNGVRANVLTPSLVEGTPLTDRLMEEGRFSAKLFAKARPKADLGPTYPEDLAALAVFLASPAAARITGQAISVNGGISAA